MGVYCEMVSDDIIQRKLSGKKNVLIIGCSACACDSLSYAKGVPSRLLNSDDKPSVETALAVKEEYERLAAILNADGINTEFCIIGHPCAFFNEEIENLIECTSGKDAVAVLACPAGFIGIRRALNGHCEKIIPMMKGAGTRVFRLMKDKNEKYCYVDKDSAIFFNKKTNKDNEK